jgi:endonuclease-3
MTCLPFRGWRARRQTWSSAQASKLLTVVDTHVHRISRRLELTKNNAPHKIEEDLIRIIPREKWILFSHQIIWHGRKLCLARSPKCANCLLENICHAEDKTWSTVEKHAGAKA